MEDDPLVICGGQVADNLLAEAKTPCRILGYSLRDDGHIVRDVGSRPCGQPVEFTTELLEDLELCSVWRSVIVSGMCDLDV